MIRINLISGPRNISTALMYSFGQRNDTIVLDEPFYAFYLLKSKVDHPGKEEIIRSQPTDETEVRNHIFKEWSKPVLFIKNMAHHIEMMQEDFLYSLLNVFLIRDPKQIITSYARVINSPAMRDIGIAYQYELYNRLKNKGYDPVVVDSGLLLENPSSVLKKLCERIKIPFTTDMLCWSAGPKPYDGVWAKHWYSNVHTSIGWQKQSSGGQLLPESLTALYEEALSYYEKLLPFSLKP